jgi:uncharacterized membrane-anchored protein
MTHSRYLLPIAIAVALVQIGILGSMIYGRAAILRDGREVTLSVLPVDPRDLLRGDYVRISYNISSLPAALVEEADKADPSERTVYVRLRPAASGVWEPVAARFGKPPDAQRQPQDVDIRGFSSVPPDAIGSSFLSVDYGIERFYLPEGEGKPIEEGIGERPFSMKVAVADDGTAQIKAFYDGDTLIHAEPIY